MPWVKAPQSLMDLFAEALPADPAVERRKMFGYPAAFVHGNMFAGVFGDQVFARVAPARRQQLEAAHGPLPFSPMPGRPMKDYVLAPEAIVADEAELADLLAGAFAFASALPPKERKGRKKG
jgi:TfoX/Sxy family transcriptional regulator of competence genes